MAPYKLTSDQRNDRQMYGRSRRQNRGKRIEAREPDKERERVKGWIACSLPNFAREMPYSRVLYVSECG